MVKGPRRAFLLLCVFLALETIPIGLHMRLAPIWVLASVLALWLAARFCIGKKAFYVACYFGLSLTSLLAGELYFRVHYLGPQALNFSRYTPRLFTYPDGKDVDPNTYTGHRPGDDVICYGKTCRFNAEGFRGPLRPRAKTKGTYRIAWVGASVGWGAGVTEEDRYTDIIERSLKVEVVNLSIIGVTFGEMLQALRDVGMKYDPDLVVFEVARTMIRHAHELALSPFHHASKSALLSDLLLSSEGLPRRLFLVNYLFQLSTNLMPATNYPSEEDEKSLMEEVVEGAKKLAGRIPLALFRVPTVNPSEEERRFDAIVAEIAARDGIPMIGGRGVEFPGPIENWTIYPGDRHPNSNGHRLIAESLLVDLKQVER